MRSDAIVVPLEYLLLGAAILLLLSVVSSKISVRLGIPSLLLFLLIGMAVGSDGPGGIYFDDAALAQRLGVTALALILFAGGLETESKLIRPVLWRGLSLATVGVFITAAAIGWFTHAILDFPLMQGLLIGAIVASTDAAAVFSVLGRSIGLKSNLKPLLQLESGSNDPMAIFLTISMISIIVDPATSLAQLGVMFVQQIVVGGLLGVGFAYALKYFINQLRLEHDGLYPVVTLAFVFLIYGVTTILGGSPFVAVYLAGIVLGNQIFIHKNSLIQFHDGLAWLMQIVMFLTLGLLVFPSRLVTVAGEGLLVAAFLILIARPLSVFVSLIPFRLGFREKVLVSWVGLRGATPIILATFPLLAGIPEADMIFNLIFFVVLTSVLLQGTMIRLAARLLKVDETIAPRNRYPIASVPSEEWKNELFEFSLPPDSPAVGRQIVDLRLPDNSLIVLLSRGMETMVPRGGTVLNEGDTLLILADRDQRDGIQALFEIGGDKGFAPQE